MGQTDPKSAKERVERKVATILFVDVADSVQLLSGLDIEDTSNALISVIEYLESIVIRHGGTVVSRLGDGIMVVFGAPNALEHHELRAVRAALDIHQGWSLRDQPVSLAENLSFYTSAHCGEILSRQDGNRNVPMEVFGDTVHLAARLNKLIGPDVVVVTKEMADRLEPYAFCDKVGDFQIKGFGPAIAVSRIDGIRHASLDMHGAHEYGLSPFVGRGNELSWLVTRFNAAVEGTGGVFRIVAEAGAGKTRLLHEFRKETSGQTPWIFRMRCETFGETLAYAPIRGVLGPYLTGTPQLEDQDLQDQLIGLSKTFLEDNERALASRALVGTLPGTSSWHGLSSIRKAELIEKMLGDFFLIISQIRPVIIEIEDIHWADAETLRWLASLSSQIKKARVFVIASSRSLANGASVPPFWDDEVHLSQLNAFFLGTIVRSKEGLSKLGNAAIDRVSLMSGGNPLFAEECAKFLHELGREAAALDDEAIERIFRLRVMGSDTQSILAARLDELSEDVRDVVAACSAVGPRFDHKIVESVLRKPTPWFMSALQTLLEAEIIFRTQAGERESYRFKHAITHEVAYRTMTRRTREEYHARILQSYEQRFGDAVFDHADLLREHAKQAGDIPSTIRYQRHAALAALARIIHQRFWIRDFCARKRFHICQGKRVRCAGFPALAFEFAGFSFGATGRCAA